jgi:hypothetical protein
MLSRHFQVYALASIDSETGGRVQLEEPPPNPSSDRPELSGTTNIALSLKEEPLFGSWSRMKHMKSAMGNWVGKGVQSTDNHRR